MAERDASPNKRCAVILTAIPAEYRAVRAHLTDLKEVTHSQGTVYEQGKFVDANGHTWQVGIIEVGPGNPGAAFETERALNHFDPGVTLFVGVAGGLKDVALGDVVAATKVYGYESGKANEEFLPRANVGESSYSMVQRAKAEARKEGWLKRIKSPLPTPPGVHVQPIAAGEKVVASKQSTVSKFLRSTYSDAVAVEMEGRGFLQAAHANQNVKSLVIRGISDLVTGKAKSDRAGYQELAAETASAFAFEVLANLEGTETKESGRYALAISATIQEVDRPKAEAIVALLRKLSGDADMVLVRVEGGSVRLVLEGSREGFERIEALFRSGRLAQELGVEVEDLSWKGEPSKEVFDHERMENATNPLTPMIAPTSETTDESQQQLKVEFPYKASDGLTELLKDADPGVRQSAAEALGRIGPDAYEAVPRLVELLRGADQEVRRTAAEALGRIGPAAVPGLIALLKDADPGVRRRVAEVLGRIGPAAAPGLIGLLRDADQEVRWSAAWALRRIGPPAALGLIGLLRDADHEARCSAAWVLGGIGPAAVPGLIGMLRDADQEVRRSAAEALGEIGRAARGAVPGLIDTPRDADQEVRRRVAEALGRIGQAVREAVPGLIGLLQDANSGVGRSATEALGRIGPDAHEAVPGLIGLLQDADKAVWRTAAEALGRIGPAAVPGLIDTLWDEDASVRRSAAEALGRIGPDAHEAVPGLIGLLRDEDQAVRRRAAWALRRIGPAAVPELIHTLWDEDASVRRSAAWALGRIGPDAHKAVPELQGLLQDVDRGVRRVAARALERIEPPGTGLREREFEPVY